MTSNADIPMGAFAPAEPIAAGGSGTMWRAHRVSDQHPVAVKVLAADRDGERALYDEFDAEVQTVARLDHPNIVRLLVHDRPSLGAPRRDTAGGGVASRGRSVEDRGMVSSAHVDRELRRALPQPLASLWSNSLRAVGSADRIDRLLHTFEFMLEATAGLLYADYALGAPTGAVRDRLEEGMSGRFTFGRWSKLILALFQALRDRESPEPFFSDAVEWYFDRGGGGRLGPRKQIDRLVETRNRVAHAKTAPTKTQQAETAQELEDGLRTLLDGARWLHRYRAFSVRSSQGTRRRTFKGRVEFAIGDGDGEPLDVEWRPLLLHDVLYAVSPDGARFLELSPMWILEADPASGRQSCHCFRGVHRKSSLVLRNPLTGTEVRTSTVPTARGEVSAIEWLASAEAYGEVADNAGFEDGFNVQIQVELLDHRFEMGELLGSGLQTDVYRAFDRVTKQDVAIKILRDRPGSDSSHIDRFLREAAVLHRVQHPHLIDIIAMSSTPEGRPYIVMPYVGGGSIADRVAAEGSLGVETALEWLNGILEGLKALHAAGVVHRNVSANNIFVRQHRVVVGDLGAAFSTADPRLTNVADELMHALLYAAPELSTKAQPTPAADVYSAAVVAHVVLNGSEPRSAPGIGIDGPVGELLREMSASTPSERPSVDEALRRVRKLLVNLDQDEDPADAIDDDAATAEQETVVIKAPAIEDEEMPTLQLADEVTAKMHALISDQLLSESGHSFERPDGWESRGAEFGAFEINYANHGRAEHVVAVTGSEIRFGRGANADIRVLVLDVKERERVQKLSRTHLLLVRTATGWSLRDAGSAHGTWLDGERIADGQLIPLSGEQHALVPAGALPFAVAPLCVDDTSEVSGALRIDRTATGEVERAFAIVLDGATWLGDSPSCGLRLLEFPPDQVQLVSADGMLWVRNVACPSSVVDAAVVAPGAEYPIAAASVVRALGRELVFTQIGGPGDSLASSTLS